MKYEYKTRMIQVWTWAAWYAIATAFVVASWCWLGSSTGYGQDTGPYVYKTGSKSTGRQVFAGINGQINLPVGNLPAFPIEGDIQNVSGVGLEVYKGGVWTLIGTGAVSPGVYVQTGPTTGSTVTGMAASSPLAWTTSGNTSTLSVAEGVTPGTVMAGDQQLSGDVTRGVTNTQLSNSVNVSTTGSVSSSQAIVPTYAEKNSAAVIDPTGTVTGTAQGSAGQILTSNGTGSAPTMQNAPAANTGGGYGSFQSLLVAAQGTSNVTFSFASVTMWDGTKSKNFPGKTTVTVNVTGSAGINGPDVANIVPSSGFLYLWALGKDDGSTGSVWSTVSDTGSHPTLPSGWTYWALSGAFPIAGSIPAGCVKFGNRTAFVGFDQTLVTGGSATSNTPLDCSASVPPTAHTAILSVELYNGSQYSQVSLYQYDMGFAAVVLAANGSSGFSSDVKWQCEMPLGFNGAQKFGYGVRSVGGNIVDIHVRGYLESVGM